MRLARRFLAAARRMKYRRETGFCQRSIETATAFARGDRQVVTADVQVAQQIFGAVEQRSRRIANAEMVPVALGDARIQRRVNVRQDMRQRVMQSQPDDVARALIRRHRQTEIGASSLQRRGDDRCRVHERPVPIEHQQIEALRHVLSAKSCRKFASSAGSGASTVSFAPLEGWRKPRLAACRNMRFKRPPRQLPVQLEVAVLVVTGDRKAQMREVHADLVRAAGFELRLRAG